MNESKIDDLEERIERIRDKMMKFVNFLVKNEEQRKYWYTEFINI